MARKYDMTKRLLQKAANDLRRTLQSLNTITDGMTPKEGRPRAERRKSRRLQQLPPDMTCPTCGKVKLSTRQWICIEGKLPQCKSCYMKQSNLIAAEAKTVDDLRMRDEDADDAVVYDVRCIVHSWSDEDTCMVCGVSRQQYNAKMGIRR